MKRFLLYLLRWQLSTPILAIVLHFTANWNYIASTIVANLIGGIVFYWVDKWIFDRKNKEEE